MHCDMEGTGMNRAVYAVGISDTYATSASRGKCMGFVLKGFDVAVYGWIYENYRPLELPWDSPWTWLFCLVGVDFGYYWCHRMAHEVNIIWAAHQVHHSSEDYNLSTALRQSIVQRLTAWVFLVPLAPFVPPAIMLVHMEFNLIFQFWIHTQVINKLGPLEYILNTPSHHRVHHGRNRYCIDKNYAGVFIIWDRIFGTFAPEKEPVVFGLVHPLQTWEPITVQYIWERIWEFEGLRDKVAFIFKGPGWSPNKPRLGLVEEIPDVHYPQPKYDTFLPTWCRAYVGIHFFISFIVMDVFTVMMKTGLTPTVALIGIGYIILTMTCIGLICDGSWYAPWGELLRCALVMYATTALRDDLVQLTNRNEVVFQVVRAIFLVSVFVWIPHLVKSQNGTKQKFKQKSE